MEASSHTAPPSVVIQRHVRARRERVYEAWTNPTLMQQWFFGGDWSAKTTNDLRVGGSYRHEMISGTTAGTCEGAESLKTGDSVVHFGEYLEIAPPDRLVFTWNSPYATNTRVTVLFSDRDGGTDIRITHELLETEQARSGHTEGWNACLDNFEKFVAKNAAERN